MELTADIRERIVKVLEAAKMDIQGKMAAEGINASGRTSRSIRVEPTAIGARLVIGGNGTKTAPLATLEVGRQGGNVPQGFSWVIYEWATDKGIQFATESEKRRFAYLTARKIAREGTLRHAQPKDIYSSVVKERSKEVTGDVAVVVTKYVHDFLINNRK